MAAKKVLSDKGARAQDSHLMGEPKRLSKAGEWMERNPKGFMIIHDMRAVMR